MDYEKRLHDITKEARERYRSGDLSLQDLRALAARAGQLKARAYYLHEIRTKAGKPSRDVDNLARLDRLAEIMDRGGTVVALDVGSNMRCVFDEVGISTWKAGAIETTTLVVDTALYRHPDDAIRVMNHPLQVYRPSLFGDAVTMPFDEIRIAAQAAADGAEMVVFHAMYADLPKLLLCVDDIRLLDTEHCGSIWTVDCPSLAELCLRSGIDTSGAHNSGNDARYTLDLAIALTKDGTRDHLRQRIALRAERDGARRLLMLRPTRKPGVEAAWQAWDEANRALAGFGKGCPTTIDRRGLERRAAGFPRQAPDESSAMRLARAQDVSSVTRSAREFRKLGELLRPSLVASSQP